MKVKNIVFGPSSSLNLASNVNISESSLDLGYNDAPNLKAPITGELISVPKEIIISSRNN